MLIAASRHSLSVPSALAWRLCGAKIDIQDGCGPKYNVTVAETLAIFQISLTNRCNERETRKETRDSAIPMSDFEDVLPA